MLWTTSTVKKYMVTTLVSKNYLTCSFSAVFVHVLFLFADCKIASEGKGGSSAYQSAPKTRPLPSNGAVSRFSAFQPRFVRESFEKHSSCFWNSHVLVRNPHRLRDLTTILHQIIILQSWLLMAIVVIERGLIAVLLPGRETDTTRRLPMLRRLLPLHKIHPSCLHFRPENPR